MRGGGADFWSADCLAALIACGINPDAAGSYSDMSAAIKKARKDHREHRIAEAAKSPGKDHEPNCSLSPRNPPPVVRGRRMASACTCYESTSPGVVAEMGALPPGSSGTETWLLANSEAGHIGADGLMRSGTARGTACSNQVPGYRPDDSFCVLHHGDASGYGMHKAVREGELEHETYLRYRYPGGEIPPDEVARGIRNNAEMTVNYSGAGPRNPGWGGERAIGVANAQRQNLAQATDQRRQDLTQELRTRAAGAGKADLVGKIDRGLVNGPNGPQPTQKAMEKAAKCIEQKAKQSITQMQRDTVDRDSTVANSPQAAAAIARENERRAARGLSPISGFTELPKDERDRVLAETRRQVADRNRALLQNPNRTEAECLELQGNQLAGQMTNDRQFPPAEGGTPNNATGTSRNRTSTGRVQPPK